MKPTNEQLLIDRAAELSDRLYALQTRAKGFSDSPNDYSARLFAIEAVKMTEAVRKISARKEAK